MARYVVRVDGGSEFGRAAVGHAPVAPLGLGIDIPTSSKLPTRAAGTPLRLLPELRSEPHAWVKPRERHAATAVATGDIR